MPRFFGHPLGGLQPARSGYVEVADAGGGRRRQGPTPARLYWEEYGAPAGRPLFLLNGGCSKIPLMGNVIQVALERGYRVLIHESRGIGRSSCQVAGRQTSTLLAADAQAVADGAWGPDSRFVLYGISLGGLVGQELMYRLVAAGQKSRVLAAWLMVTGPGSWLRPPPFLQLPLMRMAFKPTAAPAAAAPAAAPAASPAAAGGADEATNGKLSLAKGGGGAMFADDADFAARYSLESLFSNAWLDSPAPPEAIDPAAGAAGKAAVAGAVPEVHINVGADGAAAVAGGSGGHVLTRREAVWRVFKTHWRDMLALHGPSDFPAVACQLTSLLGHYLQPHRAAIIRAAGLRISVGVSTADAFFPEAAQRQLATALGAEVVQVVGAGHLDGAMLDGAYSAFDGGLGWLSASKQ
ncbi:hypothetical protein HXX76_004146 [Chlamydomonas incerta]|uniref:Serine aminopeptidase S33 domain-containing protein n=1 Tax=Chlamydomonas incerta TaxID=51695 RepID=A0A835TGR3_CHLIN|nr:hypothetical protein HXX76_004146 [Chlamydomonas incerta]|eukprot:KAG2440029.1 hypothetical protein HXX76_004146 [Chlamydomonas incerta]